MRYSQDVEKLGFASFRVRVPHPGQKKPSPQRLRGLSISGIGSIRISENHSSSKFRQHV